MKFIVDAQLPVKLKYWLIENGYEAIHTNELNFHLIDKYFKSGSKVIEFDNDSIIVHA